MSKNSPRRAGRRRHLLLATCAVATALVSSACGGGSGSGSSSAGSASSGSAGADLGTLNVITAISQSTPYIAAETGPELDAWKGTGLKVNLIAGKTATVTPALASGSADIGVTAGNEAAVATVQGVQTVIPACIMAPWRQNLIVSAKENINSPSDLKGKTLGISAKGSAGDFANTRLAAQQHWSSDDYKVVALGTVQGLEAGLQSGQISAFIWNPAVAADLQAKGIAKDLGSVQDIVGANCFESFQVSKKVLQERPAAVKAFFEGYFKNVAYLKSHYDAARKIVVDEWHYSADTVDKYLHDDINALSDDGKITSAQLNGLLKATQVIVPDATTAQIKSAYSYWGNIK